MLGTYSSGNSYYQATPDSGGVGIGRGEAILYFDKSRAKRRVNAPSTYAINGEVIRIRITEARTPRTLTRNALSP